MDQKSYELLKESFYGWEFCVENNLKPTITSEDIELLMNLFIEYEDYKAAEQALKLSRVGSGEK